MDLTDETVRQLPSSPALELSNEQDAACVHQSEFYIWLDRWQAVLCRHCLTADDAPLLIGVAFLEGALD